MQRRTVIVALLLLGAKSIAQKWIDGAKTMQSRAKQYLACRTARDRLLFCIAAIDDGSIDIRVNIDDLRLLFGEDFADLGPLGTEGTNGAAIVTFEQLPKLPATSEDASRLPKGWYLYVEYDGSRRIRKYWLSDMHKGLPKRDQ
jgi:hypothetical protein